MEVRKLLRAGTGVCTILFRGLCSELPTRSKRNCEMGQRACNSTHIAGHELNHKSRLRTGLGLAGEKVESLVP